MSLLVRNASLRFPDTGSKKLITLVDTGTKMSPKYIMAFHMRKRFRGKAVMSRMVTRLLEGGTGGEDVRRHHCQNVQGAGGG